MSHDVLVTDDVRQHVTTVQQHHEPALVETRVPLQPIEARQGLVIDLVQLAGHAGSPTARERGEAAEVVERVDRRGDGDAAHPRTGEEPVIRLAAEEGSGPRSRRDRHRQGARCAVRSRQEPTR